MDNNVYSINPQLYGGAFGENRSKIKAVFRKTVYVKQYETETMEFEVELEFDKPVSEAERNYAVHRLEAQLEAAAFRNAMSKGFVSTHEYNERMMAIDKHLNETAYNMGVRK